MPPTTRYAASPRGDIAYQVIGDGPIDLVYMSGGTSHVDVRWESPSFTRFLERLASFSRVITFDRRGTGASDPVPPESLPTWEDWADDLRTVLDSVGAQRPAIFANLDGGPVAMIFAATNPDRVRALILGNTTARLRASDDYPIGISDEAYEGFVGAVTTGWGTEEFAAAVSPSFDAEERLWFAKYLRASATPRSYLAYVRSGSSLDVRGVLSSIRIPTLILHRRELFFFPLSHARFLAGHIADSKLIELGGSDTVLFVGPDTALVLDSIEEFLTGVRRGPAPDRVLATVLFTDLVASTQLASNVGDRKWRDLLDHHDRVARISVETNRGRMLKTTGDGILATFDSPSRAVHCARHLRKELESLSLSMRAGLHTGEIEVRGEDVTGIGVVIAARVGALAGAGEILASRTVVDLVAGSGLSFMERGPQTLKGVPGIWHVFAVAD
jgi:class 3 adenylate cyclase